MEKLKIKVEEAVDVVSRLEKVSYYILLATAFLIPIFFIPSTSFQFQFSKSVFISFAVLVSLALWLIARLKDGRYLLPNNSVFWGAALVLAVLLISALLSPSVRTSFMGQGFEIGTWANTAIMFAMMFLFSALFRTKEKIFYLYLALFASSLLIVLFHVVRFVPWLGPEFLSFGIFTDITSNLIGKWNDLGIFFGLVAILSLITIELVQLNKIFKTVLWVIFGLSVVLLTIVNFPTLWYALGSFGLLYFVYAYAFKGQFAPRTEGSGDVSLRKPGMVRGGVVAILLVLLSLGFLVDYYTPNKPVSNGISRLFTISNLEVRPNFSSTVSVARDSLKTNPVFGAGPNRFMSQWALYKPIGINEGLFWNTDFFYGVSFLSTQLVTSGGLGFAAWLFFICAIVYLGLRYLLTPITDQLKRYLSVSSFFASLFLWSFFVLYIPSTAIFSLTFLFTGIFLASLYNEQLLKPKTISFEDEPKVSFVSALLLIVLLVGVVALAYGLGQKFVASAYFQRSLIVLDEGGDISRVEKLAERAQSISQNDMYARFLSEVAISDINQLLNDSASVSTDEVRSKFQTFLGNAIRYAREAVDLDAANYQNWISLGGVYEAVVPLGIEGAYEAAADAYKQALALNPKGPQVRLIQARLELARQNNKQAQEKIQEALSLKSNYTEGLFLLAQIQVDEGKVREAIASVESVSVLAPNDPTVFFQLGVLKYNNRDYSGAREALERSVQLSPSYSNAKYFLGLSYHKLGRVSDALTQFNDIAVLNPDNTEVPTIIANIKAGKDPFATLDPSSRPENRDTLPIDESPIEEEN